jgi:hypothetical protein
MIDMATTNDDDDDDVVIVASDTERTMASSERSGKRVRMMDVTTSDDDVAAVDETKRAITFQLLETLKCPVCLEIVRSAPIFRNQCYKTRMFLIFSFAR